MVSNWLTWMTAGTGIEKAFLEVERKLDMNVGIADDSFPNVKRYLAVQGLFVRMYGFKDCCDGDGADAGNHFPGGLACLCLCGRIAGTTWKSREIAKRTGTGRRRPRSYPVFTILV